MSDRLFEAFAPAQPASRASEPHPVIWAGSKPTQRAFMRDLYAALGDDRRTVYLAYVEAELRGDVAQLPGTENMSSNARAKALWQDGKLKGWLRA